VEPIVQETVDSLRPSAEIKHIDVTLTLGSIGPVVVDPERLRQIVWNLMSNAVKFTPEGGRVEVACRADRTNMVLSVCDTGIGFNQDLGVHLFERFRQGDSSTTRPYSGLGLGLGIVRHLTE